MGEAKLDRLRRPVRGGMTHEDLEMVMGYTSVSGGNDWTCLECEKEADGFVKTCECASTMLLKRDEYRPSSKGGSINPQIRVAEPPAHA